MELGKEDPGASGAEGGISEKVADEGDKGDCGDRSGGLVRSNDLRLRSLVGLPISTLLLLDERCSSREGRPRRGAGRLSCATTKDWMLCRSSAIRDVSGYLLQYRSSESQD